VGTSSGRTGCSIPCCIDSSGSATVEARWEVSESGRRRKYYRITPEGRAQLAEERRQWQAVDSTLRGIWQLLSVSIPVSQPPSHVLQPQGA
jgi:hypothetical protein